MNRRILDRWRYIQFDSNINDDLFNSTTNEELNRLKKYLNRNAIDYFIQICKDLYDSDTNIVVINDVVFDDVKTISNVTFTSSSKKLLKFNSSKRVFNFAFQSNSISKSLIDEIFISRKKSFDRARKRFSMKKFKFSDNVDA